MKSLIITLLLTGTSLLVQGQEKISAYMDKAVYNTPFDAPYLETYLGVETQTLTLKEGKDGWQAAVDVTVLVKDGEKIVNFDTYRLSTGWQQDTAQIVSTLLMQRRLALEEGVYALETTLRDAYDTSRQIALPILPVMVDFPDGTVNFSDIHLLASAEKTTSTSVFERNGFDMMPYLLPYFPTSQNKIMFYTEVYGLEEEYLNEDVLFTYFISTKGASQHIGTMHGYQKKKGADVNVLLSTLDIKDLPTGEYQLHVQVRDKQNKLIAEKRKNFYRSNKRAISDFNNLAHLDIEHTFVAGYTDEQVAYYLDASAIIASAREQEIIETVKAQGDPMLQRQFLYNFWLERDLTNPKERWEKYLALVRYTEANYATMNRHGFQTDRGRVYLQYGPPNEMDRSGFEAASNPHEVWVYNRTPRGETNVIFVFMNKDMVSNDYRLIHSTATGEIFNQNWEAELYNTFTSPTIDGANTRDHFGTKVTDQYDYINQRDR